MSLWTAIAKAITAQTPYDFDPVSQKSVSGGCIHKCYQLDSRYGKKVFVKINDIAHAAVLEEEAVCLEALAQTQSLTIPKPWCLGRYQNKHFLVMDYLALSSKGSAEQLGRQLAQLHQHTHHQFGWPTDNYIGLTPQHNRFNTNWIEFYRDCRLLPQFTLAQAKGFCFSQQQRLLDQLPEYFSEYTPVASLLHGDLWSGNYAYGPNGSPCVFDPACYYGDRETDLALTELFGGFSTAFYQSYNATWPLDAGYQRRKLLYQLYHLLNHCNLFGSGYFTQTQEAVDALVA